MTASPSRPPEDAPLPTAVMGSGRWGQILAREIERTPGLTLAAVISRSNVSGELEGAPRVPDIDDALDLGARALVLAVPPDRQAGLAPSLIEAGLPLFLEKPLTLGVLEAEAILARAKAHGFIGIVDHLHLYTEEFQALRREAAKLTEDLGLPGNITTRSGARGPFRDGWSALWDWGAHDAAMVLSIAGQAPVSVGCEVSRRVETDDGLLENHHLQLTFKNKWAARIETGNAFDDRVRQFRVTWPGAKTTLVYEERADRTLAAWCERDGNRASLLDRPGPPPLTASLATFEERIRRADDAAREASLADLELGARVVTVLSKAERSTQRHA